MLARAHVLNAIAYAALWLGSPVEAKRIVTVAARGLRAHVVGDDHARRIAGALRFGTCLSRSLALAAMMDDAEVVIGVRPGESPSEGPAEGRSDGPVEAESIARSVHAHAWVERGGRPLRPGDVVGSVIARL